MTVVYLGYVDIGFIGGDLAKARAGYRDGIARLVRGGAASGANRLLLVEPHDVGSMPLFNRTAKRGALRRETEDWRGFVAGTARHGRGDAGGRVRGDRPGAEGPAPRTGSRT